MATNNSINTYEIPTAAGERTMPLQPAFAAYNNTLRTDITGDSTLYSVIFEVEDVDQNGDYDHTTGVFTAPVTGFYIFNASVHLLDLAAGHTEGRLSFYINGSSSNCASISNYAFMRDPSDELCLNIKTGAYLTAADTVNVRLAVLGAAKAVDIPAGILTIFSGTLVF